MTSISDLKYTLVGAIPDKVEEVRRAFSSHKTRPLDFRLTQLRKLYWGWVKRSSPAEVEQI